MAVYSVGSRLGEMACLLNQTLTGRRIEFAPHVAISQLRRRSSSEAGTQGVETFKFFGRSNRTQEQREEHSGVLVSRVEKLAAAAEEILAMAKADKNLNAATGAINAATRLLELVGRPSGELQSANAGGIHLTMNKISNSTVVD